MSTERRQLLCILAWVVTPIIVTASLEGADSQTNNGAFAFVHATVIDGTGGRQAQPDGPRLPQSWAQGLCAA